jgi:nucleotide-binding universal stress UspA family protein
MNLSGPILVAVHDSPAAFRAAEVAISIARSVGAELHTLNVADPARSEVGARVGGDLAVREAQRGAEASLRHVASRADAAGVRVVAHRRAGSPAACILEEARALGAALIVMAVVDHPRHPNPYVGAQTLRVLEFSRVPVLVVPADEKAG